MKVTGLALGEEGSALLKPLLSALVNILYISNIGLLLIFKNEIL